MQWNIKESVSRINLKHLRGGYYDAGDYIKFGFPLSFSLSLLSWGGLEFTAGYEDTGLIGELEETVR